MVCNSYFEERDWGKLYVKRESLQYNQQLKAFFCYMLRVENSVRCQKSRMYILVQRYISTENSHTRNIWVRGSVFSLGKPKKAVIKFAYKILMRQSSVYSILISNSQQVDPFFLDRQSAGFVYQRTRGKPRRDYICFRNTQIGFR